MVTSAKARDALTMALQDSAEGDTVESTLGKALLEALGAEVCVRVCVWVCQRVRHGLRMVCSCSKSGSGHRITSSPGYQRGVLGPHV